MPASLPGSLKKLCFASWGLLRNADVRSRVQPSAPCRTAGGVCGHRKGSSAEQQWGRVPASSEGSLLVGFGFGEAVAGLLGVSLRVLGLTVAL